MSTTPHFSLTAGHRLSHALLWALLVTAAGSQSGLAQDKEPAGPRLTPDQQAKVFPDRKALLLKDQQRQIQILQKAERCTRAATNQASLRTCQQDQRKAQQALRQEHREATKALYERNGITPPADRREGKAGTR
ncbi:MAG: hypothetical protein VKM34_01735 [Cyanobacteriota bacterium]|nr:hypothetical protein [Cyanobacteriota bacterium]